MGIFFTNWLKSSKYKSQQGVTSEKNDCSDCTDFNKCMTVLELVLDNEASEEEHQFFKEHIEKCMPCFSKFTNEKDIRALIKLKIQKKVVPSDLIQSIKTKIQETV